VIRYLLDTNILSNLVRRPRGRVAQKIAASGGSGACATSIVVAGEMRFGALKRGSARLSASVEAVLGAITILPVEPDADRHYGVIRHELERAGRMIGANDLWIAAQALAGDLTLVSDNVGEFGRIDRLRLENWLNETPEG
jgi:tRNA(fMet)-specific endonuclease VapC